jgi:hypothetical protein
VVVVVVVVVVVYTDSMNIYMFNTLYAQPSYNQLLISSVDTQSCSSLNVCAYNVAGEQNIIADAISCNNFKLAIQMIPNLTILPFTPSQDVLGAPSQ